MLCVLTSLKKTDRSSCTLVTAAVRTHPSPCFGKAFKNLPVEKPLASACKGRSVILQPLKVRKNINVNEGDRKTSFFGGCCEL